MRGGAGSWARSSTGARGCAGPGVSAPGPGPGRAAAARRRHGRSVWAPAGSCLLLRVSLAVRIAASHHWRRPGRFLRAGGEGAGGRGRARARAGTMRMRGPGAPPSGRGRTGAQLAWVRRAHIKGGPACLPACRGLSTASSSFSWRLWLEGGAQTLSDRTGSSEGAEPARLELVSAGSRRSSARGSNDPRRGVNAAGIGQAVVPKNAVRCRKPHSPTFAPSTHSALSHTHQRLSGEAGQDQPPGRPHLRRGGHFYLPCESTQDRGVSQLPSRTAGHTK